MGKTLFDKIWDAHVVQNVEDGPTQLYIDRLYAHEVTSPQAFDTLRDKNIIVPVVRKTADGFRKLDRSNYGHVAQYCITRDIWKLVSLDEGSKDASQQSS